jgi:hypothetical protein
MASTGASRRTVAAQVGKPESTIRGWVERGKAYPDVEPWGSFAVDYERAERGLAASAASTTAMRAQLLNEQMAKRLAWESRGPPPRKPPKPAKPRPVNDDAEQLANELRHELASKEYEKALEDWALAVQAHNTPPPTPEIQYMLCLERVRISRHPYDYGTSKHRKPEPEHDGTNYLNEHAMDREQLGALLLDPPELLRLAIVDQAYAVYRILVASGFDPAVPEMRKADDETEGPAGSHEPEPLG